MYYGQHHSQTEPGDTTMKRTSAVAAIAIAAAMLVVGCSDDSVDTTQILADHWNRVGTSGQVQLCRGFDQFGGDWMVERYDPSGEKLDAEEIVAFFEDRC